MCEPCTPDALLEAVRGLRVAEPDLGFKPLLAKLRAQQPGLGAATNRPQGAGTPARAYRYRLPICRAYRYRCWPPPSSPSPHLMSIFRLLRRRTRDLPISSRDDLH